MSGHKQMSVYKDNSVRKSHFENHGIHRKLLFEGFGYVLNKKEGEKSKEMRSP